MWYKKYGYSTDAVRQYPLARIRNELLAVKGVGFETADSILLYAFSYPTFVVDAYTKRLLERLHKDVRLKTSVYREFSSTPSHLFHILM